MFKLVIEHINIKETTVVSFDCIYKAFASYDEYRKYYPGGNINLYKGNELIRKNIRGFYSDFLKNSVCVLTVKVPTNKGDITGYIGENFSVVFNIDEASLMDYAEARMHKYNLNVRGDLKGCVDFLFV